MIEIDNSIIDPGELLRRVRQNILKIDGSEVRSVRQSMQETVPAGHGEQFAAELERIESDLDSMLENIQAMNRTWLHEDAQLKSRSALLRPLVIFVKRAIRKTIYWFTQPYVEQQTAFNGAATRAISDCLRAQRALAESLKK